MSKERTDYLTLLAITLRRFNFGLAQKRKAGAFAAVAAHGLVVVIASAPIASHAACPATAATINDDGTT